MLGALENVLKERLAHAVLEIVAARAGCNVMQPPSDYSSVDAVLKQISGKPGYQIDVQLKGSSSLNVDKDSIKFKLKKKNYDDLRETNVITPRMLVVAHLAESSKDWVECNARSIIFSNSIFWLDLCGSPSAAGKTSITVKIPRVNVLSAEKLADLMKTGFDNLKSGKGGLL